VVESAVGIVREIVVDLGFIRLFWAFASVASTGSSEAKQVVIVQEVVRCHVFGEVEGVAVMVEVPGMLREEVVLLCVFQAHEIPVAGSLMPSVYKTVCDESLGCQMVEFVLGRIVAGNFHKGRRVEDGKRAFLCEVGGPL
jgi:hypothetical protein